MIAYKKVKMKISDMPHYHRGGVKNKNTYILLGAVKKGGNEPYCFAEEKQCAGCICRVMAPNKTLDEALVIREDGTVWKIQLSNFTSWELIEIIRAEENDEILY